MRFYFVASLTVAAGVAGSLTGCAGSLKDPAEFQSDSGSSTVDAESNMPSCATDVPPVVFQQTCGVAGCHSATAPAQGLDLVSSNVAARLVNVPETEMQGLGLLLIDSADPAKSVILTKIQAATVPYGAQMPYERTPLTSEEVACVTAWVDAVAADAGADGGATGTPDGGGEAAATDDATSVTPPDVDSGGAPADAGADVASESGGLDTIRVLNYKAWCSVTINGGTASTSATLTASVASGSTVTVVATPASKSFVIGKDPWFGVTQDNGAAAPGTDKGTGSTETSTATVVAASATCVSVCCGDAPSGTNCPTANPCK
jgi:hypothetical protein